MSGNHNAAPSLGLCPVCRVAMRTEQHRTLILDRCSQCSGLWFDRHELDAYCRALPAVSARVTAPTAVPNAEPLPCPRCRTETLRSYRAEAVLISRCSTCGGMYLDGNDVRALNGKRLQYRAVEEASAGAGQRTSEIMGGVAGEAIVETIVTAGFRAAIAALKAL